MKLLTTEPMPGVNLSAYQCAMAGYAQWPRDSMDWLPPAALRDVFTSQPDGPLLIDYEPDNAGGWTLQRAQQARLAIAYANILRPKLMPSIGYIAQASFWGEDWMVDRTIAGLKASVKWDVLKASDRLMVEIYQQYVADEMGPEMPALLDRFIDRNCELNAALGALLGKPWDAVVMAQYHDGSRLPGYYMYKPALLTYTKRIASHRPANIIHWGSRAYLRKIANATDAELLAWGESQASRTAMQAIFAADTRSDVQAWSETLATYREAMA